MLGRKIRPLLALATRKKREKKIKNVESIHVLQGDLSDACTNFTSQTDIGFSVQTREPKSQAVSNGKKIITGN